MKSVLVLRGELAKNYYESSPYSELDGIKCSDQKKRSALVTLIVHSACGSCFAHRRFQTMKFRFWLARCVGFGERLQKLGWVRYL